MGRLMTTIVMLPATLPVIRSIAADDQCCAHAETESTKTCVQSCASIRKLHHYYYWLKRRDGA
eukprot:10006032-Prorocentrum_lima.AAC.1